MIRLVALAALCCPVLFCFAAACTDETSGTPEAASSSPSPTPSSCLDSPASCESSQGGACMPTGDTDPVTVPLRYQADVDLRNGYQVRFAGMSDYSDPNAELRLTVTWDVADDCRGSTQLAVHSGDTATAGGLTITVDEVTETVGGRPPQVTVTYEPAD